MFLVIWITQTLTDTKITVNSEVMDVYVCYLRPLCKDEKYPLPNKFLVVEEGETMTSLSSS